MYYTYSIHTFKSSCCKMSGVSTVSTVNLVSSPFPNRTHCRQPFHYHQPLSLQRFVWIITCRLLYCSLLNIRPLHVLFHIYKKKQQFEDAKVLSATEEGIGPSTNEAPGSVSKRTRTPMTTSTMPPDMGCARISFMVAR